MSPEPRRPGQSNESYEGRAGARQSVQRDFLGTSSVAHGGDPSFAVRLFRALFAWRDRRKR
ncbi:hypothetical protein [Nocardioides dokdonensis]|nr:hypothetical protein [Nocardioides dokdonensis]